MTKNNSRAIRAARLCTTLAITIAPISAYAQSADTPPPWVNGSSGTGGASKPGLGPNTGQSPANPFDHPPGIANHGQPNHNRPGMVQTVNHNIPLGLMQPAWQNPTHHMGAKQIKPGLRLINWQPGTTHIVTTRQNMVTNIIFPNTITITHFLLSDAGSLKQPGTYQVAIAPNQHSVSLIPNYVGVDSSLNVYGASGNLYTFYLESYPWNNPTITDINVAINVPDKGSILEPIRRHHANDDNGYGGSYGTGNSYDESNDQSRGYNTIKRVDGTRYDENPSARLTERPRADETRPGVDYAPHASTGNGRIRTNISILIPSPADAVIAPVAAWRGDRFTYLDFGPRADSMNEWPVASLVVDGSSSPVETRVTGPNRSIMVVDAIGNITLREGDHIVCIHEHFQDGDTRLPIEDQPYTNNIHSYTVPTNIEQNVPPPLGVTGPGTGDYTGDLTKQQKETSEPTWPNENGKQTFQPFRIASGYYTTAQANLLATKITNGYHGNQPAGVAIKTTPPAEVGPGPYPPNINGAVSTIDITTASPVLATKLCLTLREYNHTCRLY